jgi:hypothetical protein
MSIDKNTPSNRLVTVLDNEDLTPENYASVNNAIDMLRTQAAKITQLQAEVEALRKDAEWKSIETAPKDYVTEFDGWNGERVTNISWGHPAYSPKGHFAWCVSEYVDHHGNDNVEVKGLTHWKPIPQPPAITGEST